MIVLRGALLGAIGLASSSLAAQQVKLVKPAAALTHQFSSITGFRELPDGRVLVSDGVDQALLRADLASQRIDTIGRGGQGPGEYKSPDVLVPLPGGSTLLTDLGNGRLTIFDGAGKYRESIPIAQGGAGTGLGTLRLLLVRASDGNGRLYYQPAGADPRADSAAILRWDRASGKTDTVARVKLPKLITKSSGGANSRSIRQRPPPYPLQEGWAVAADGRVALIRVGEYRVDWVLPNGTRVVGKPLALSPVSVTTAEKKEYLEEQATNGLAVSVQNVNGQISMTMSRGRAGGEERDEQDLEGQEWPATKPPTTGVYLAGPDESVWIERSVAAHQPRVYDVVGAQGQLVRQVVLPAGRRAIGIGVKGLYAKYQDDNGVSFLERYDLK
jgi:hypothetical protein